MPSSASSTERAQRPRRFNIGPPREHLHPSRTLRPPQPPRWRPAALFLRPRAVVQQRRRASPHVASPALAAAFAPSVRKNISCLLCQLSAPVPRASRSQLRYRQTLMHRSTVLPESEPSCTFHPAEPSVASTRGRRRRTDDILCSYEMGSCSTDYFLPVLQQGDGSEHSCTIQMPTSSQRTRRRISGVATSATPDLTSQCLSRQKHSRVLSHLLPRSRIRS